MNISVLGCGRWGSCIAWYLDKIGHNVLSCGLENAPEFIQLKNTHKNDYLTFPQSIEVSSDLGHAVDRAEVIVISISSQYLRSYFEDISRFNLDGKIIVFRQGSTPPKFGANNLNTQPFIDSSENILREMYKLAESFCQR